MSSLAAAHFLVRSGVEPILQITCRGPQPHRPSGRVARRRGRSASAIFSRCAATTPKLGDQPDTKPVFDLGYDRLARDGAADAIPSTGFLRAPRSRGAVAVRARRGGVARRPAGRLAPRRPCYRKWKAGAEFIQTQFCMDPEAVRRYAARFARSGRPRKKLPILIGVAPIPSARSARWMKEKLFGSDDPGPRRGSARARRRPESRGQGRSASSFCSSSHRPRAWPVRT